jgi:hypothetical protein
MVGEPCGFREIGRPVSLLGLLLGVIHGHLKKTKQRQGQIEKSGDRMNSAKP